MASWIDAAAKANQIILEYALARMKKNRDQLPALMVAKFRRIWSNNDQLLDSALIGSDNYDVIEYAKVVDAFTYLSLTVLAIVSALAALARRSRQDIYVMQLLILGMAIILQLSEAQMRYRSTLAPYIAILAALGLREMVWFAAARRR